MKKKSITKTALAISIVLIIVWSLLGTASSIAWFSDSDTIVNKFQFGDLNVELYRRTPGGDYELVTAATKLFKDEALYEPGYTQIVNLKVKNAGDVPFDYKFALLPTNVVDGTGVFGNTIHLPDYLKFGIVVKNTETEMLAATQNRAVARSFANTPLNNYAEPEPQTDLAPGAEQYIALILCMPEEIGNEANFRIKEAGLDLAVNVRATQIEARGKITD